MNEFSKVNSFIIQKVCQICKIYAYFDVGVVWVDYFYKDLMILKCCMLSNLSSYAHLFLSRKHFFSIILFIHTQYRSYKMKKQQQQNSTIHTQYMYYTKYKCCICEAFWPVVFGMNYFGWYIRQININWQQKIQTHAGTLIIRYFARKNQFQTECIIRPQQCMDTNTQNSFRRNLRSEFEYNLLRDVRKKRAIYQSYNESY
eukprot:TRINITY_DN4707_c1_g1_i7.p1 TRINITY_DN4707_c1_g1~~TRINITY_DN4707_c1_g1_i7.p1  ORF type:complete len:201 (-),score=-22.54 TRINITY_DN4707_c1_g1_i7:320-922(-)